MIAKYARPRHKRQASRAEHQQIRQTDRVQADQRKRAAKGFHPAGGIQPGHKFTSGR